MDVRVWTLASLIAGRLWSHPMIMITNVRRGAVSRLGNGVQVAGNHLIEMKQRSAGRAIVRIQ